jgi:signal transduction histidine kinase
MERSMDDISELSSPSSGGGRNLPVGGDGLGHAPGPAASSAPRVAGKLDAAITADIASVARIDAVASILEVVCRTTGMGFAAVARVTEERWVACAVRDEIAFGLLPGGELSVKTTICDEIRASGTPVVIDHVEKDEKFQTHHTPAIYGFQSYISMPIFLPGGSFFGTLCAIDPRPAKLNSPEIIGLFKNFAQLIAFHLDAQERAARQEAALLDERETAELREQFIAVLGHDLRNPLASIEAGARLLMKQNLDERSVAILDQLQKSTGRMAALIGDMLDFARGRLGGGFSLNRDPACLLAPVLEQVVDELRTAWAGRSIETTFCLKSAVDCDPARIAQLVSNLTDNALKHGTGTVEISTAAANGIFELAVENEGEPIPPRVSERLFQPFFRVARQSGYEGLGLGLYIASEIARAHGGALTVEAHGRRTRFTLRMPLAAAAAA